MPKEGITMEPNDLLAVTGALTAISIAIFVFLLPKTVEIYNTRWKAMLSVDMPDYIKNSKRFRTEIFLDTIGMYVLAFASISAGIYFTSILINVVSLSLGLEPTFLISSSLPEAFLDGAKGVWWILWATAVIALLWLGAGKFVSKSLPVITRAFAQITLDSKGSATLTQELLDSARDFLQKGEYNQAILHAATSLEYELRRMTNLGPAYSYTAVMSRFSKIELQDITSEQLDKIVIARNNIAHQKNGQAYRREEAKEIVELVSTFITKLGQLGISAIYY
jgi:hypothetical protein